MLGSPMAKAAKLACLASSALALTLLPACSKSADTTAATTDTASTTTTTDAAAPATADAAAPAATPAAPAAPAADNTDTLDGKKLADFKGDAAAGEKTFIQCKTCHVVDPGVNRIGPSLHAVVGRAAGTIPGFMYSDANKKSGITWSEAKLFQYLEKPQRVVPGTKMTFPGLPDAQTRANVIAYLKTQS